MKHLKFLLFLTTASCIAIIAWVIILNQRNDTEDAQLISIHTDNGTVSEVIKQIKKQTGIGYSLDDDLLKSAKRVTLHWDDACIMAILDTISDGQPFTAVCQNNLISLQERETIDER